MEERLAEKVRVEVYPDSQLFNDEQVLLALLTGVSVGPILLGAGRSVHVLNRTVTARGIVNMSAFAVVEAQTRGA